MMREVRSLIQLKPNTFYRLGVGYALVTEAVEPSLFTIGKTVVKGVSTIEVSELLVFGKFVGYYLECGFTLTNAGAYLILSHPRKVAEEYRVVFANEHLVVVDYKLAGALAIVPALNKKLTSMLSEQ